MNVVLETVMYAMLSTVNTCELIIPLSNPTFCYYIYFVTISILLLYLYLFCYHICFVIISVLLVKQHAITSSHKIYNNNSNIKAVLHQKSH